MFFTRIFKRVDRLENELKELKELKQKVKEIETSTCKHEFEYDRIYCGGFGGYSMSYKKQCKKCNTIIGITESEYLLEKEKEQLKPRVKSG